jgi:hypothetical protein
MAPDEPIHAIQSRVALHENEVMLCILPLSQDARRTGGARNGP